MGSAERCFWKLVELEVGELSDSSLMGTEIGSQGKFPTLVSVRFFSQSCTVLADRR